MFDFFWKGFVLGFAIAVPVGPIGILCIRKTLQFGKVSGLCSGLGAAAADALYGFFAVFGLSFFSSFIVSYSAYLKIIGSLVLFYLSYRSFISKPHPPEDRLHHMSLVKDFVATFFLTLTNPLTFLCYLAIFATMGLNTLIENSMSSWLLVMGVFSGAATWWLILSEGVGLFRHRLNQNTMIWMNRTAGIVIGAFGLYSVISLFISK